MPDPLSVRINDGTTDRHVTKYVSGLGWTKTAPGGHQGLKFRLNLPRRVFNDLGPADKAWVYDARTGRTVFGAAYLENPTPVDGASGQAYDISAVGGMALANDETRGLVYVDRDVSAFEKSPVAADRDGFNVDTSQWAINTIYNRVRTQFSSGQVVATGDYVDALYDRLARAGMTLGAVRVYVISGQTDTGYRTTLFLDASTVDVGDGAAMNAGSIDDTRWSGTDFASGSTSFLSYGLRRVGAPTNIASDNVYTDFVDIYVLGQRVNRYGALLTGAAGLGSARSVLASQVVEDLLGRLLTMCDPATAQVDATAFAIDQLVYEDGAKAAAVLDDLATFEPDFWWGIHESNDAGLHRFGFQQWATEPRYVVSVADGWRQNGSDIDLCNRVLVSWTDAAGKQQATPVTAASLGLVGVGLPVDALGSRVKDADPISLPDGHGSEANALQIGAAVLRDKINPPRAGTVTVSRPIIDMVTGNRVMPWELEPGWPVLVREPGYQMRCTEVDYDHDSRSAVLTLGTPVLTESQRIARL